MLSEKVRLKNYMLDDSIYLMFQKAQYYRDKKGISGCRGIGSGSGEKRERN